MPLQPYFDPSHRAVGAKRRVLLERRFLEHRLVLGAILTVGRVAPPRSGRVSYTGFTIVSGPWHQRRGGWSCPCNAAGYGDSGSTEPLLSLLKHLKAFRLAG